MQCPVCKEYKLGPIVLLEGLPARQCPNCKGVYLPSNAYMTWRRTLGSGLPEKEGAIEIDPSWDVKELKFCPDCGHIMAATRSSLTPISIWTAAATATASGSSSGSGKC
jgi:hypothetical protein